MLAFGGDQGDAVGLTEFDFRRVFDGDESLMVADLFRNGVQERGFAARGATGDEDVFTRSYRFANKAGMVVGGEQFFEALIRVVVVVTTATDGVGERTVGFVVAK